jgi:hypothetical protein
VSRRSGRMQAVSPQAHVMYVKTNLGLTTPEVASISGHRDIGMLMRYAHQMRQPIIEQMDKGERRKTL